MCARKLNRVIKLDPSDNVAPKLAFSASYPTSASFLMSELQVRLPYCPLLLFGRVIEHQCANLNALAGLRQRIRQGVPEGSVRACCFAISFAVSCSQSGANSPFASTVGSESNIFNSNTS